MDDHPTPTGPTPTGPTPTDRADDLVAGLHLATCVGDWDEVAALAHRLELLALTHPRGDGPRP